jgi:hypothetical protein
MATTTEATSSMLPAQPTLAMTKDDKYTRKYHSEDSKRQHRRVSPG